MLIKTKTYLPNIAITAIFLAEFSFESFFRKIKIIEEFWEEKAY